MLPGLILLAAFLYYPLAQAFGLSVFSWNLLGKPRFVGAAQYEALLGSSTFIHSLGITLLYTVVTSVLAYSLSISCALLLNQRLRGVKAARTVSIIPAIIPMVIAGLLWRFIYEPTSGPLNTILEAVGIPGQAWLQDSSLALGAIIVVSVWKDFGIYMLVLLGGLQQIPQGITEAAIVDGTNAWQRFTRVIFPMLGPANLFVLVMLIFNSFKVFDQVWVMTGGGPGDATMTIITFLYTRLFSDVGFAAAGTVVLFLLVMIPLSLQFLSRRKANA
jgi:ABC-type sugar transport system permease subunit